MTERITHVPLPAVLALHKCGCTTTEIAAIFSVSRSTIYRIIQREYIDALPSLEPHKAVVEHYWHNGYNYAYIADKVGLSYAGVFSITNPPDISTFIERRRRNTSEGKMTENIQAALDEHDEWLDKVLEARKQKASIYV